MTPAELRSRLSAGGELAVLDVRTPLARSRGHLALSCGVPLHVLEQHVHVVVPHHDTTVVLASDPSLDERAAVALVGLGYTDVHVLDGGIDAWTAAGERIYTGSGVRSKTLGEWIEVIFGTPTVEPAEVARWREAGEDVVVLDSRPSSEYAHHHLPGGLDTGGGAELAYRGLSSVPGPDTRIVVNCAGRTRGIMGAQSLRNVGVPNPVYSLHNGTPNWGWAGLELERGSGPSLPPPAEVSTSLRDWASTTLAEAGAEIASAEDLARWWADTSRTTYLVDVRRPDEVAEGTVPGALAVQGGQLVQATDDHLAVRGARVVLVDSADLVRSAGTVQWLRYLHDGPLAVVVFAPDLPGRAPAASPTPPAVPTITPAALAEDASLLVLDLRTSRDHAAGHVPGSVLARREDLPQALPDVRRVALVGGRGATSGAADLQAPASRDYQPEWVAQDLIAAGIDVAVLDGSPLKVTTDDPRSLVEVSDHVGPPAFGPERDAWYEAYFAWEHSLLRDSAGDPDFAFDHLTDHLTEDRT